MKNKLLIFLTLLLPFLVYAQEFSGDNAFELVKELCSTEFAGRKSGDPEQKLAEKWAADKFAEYGLLPGAGDDYLQTFPILNNREIKASLELLNGYHGKKKYVHGEDFHLVTNSGSGSVKTEVVFVGYGICEPERNWDDYAGIDLKGKIALIYRDVPGAERHWEEQKWRDYKVNKAIEHGAVAILFCSKDYSIAGAAIHEVAFDPDLPMVMLSEHVVDDIFRGTGKRWSNFQENMKNGPCSFSTGKIVKVETKLRYNPDAVASNVIGILPGWDSKLKSEFIVVGGHLDHCGTSGNGDVFYGADDNASGAAVVLELSRYFASLEMPPKRSVIFILFAAEEQGLLGSKYYVENSTVDLGNIAAMLNFDCCGVGDGKVGIGGFEYFPELYSAFENQLEEEDSENLNISRAWSYGSDNYSFYNEGIPAFNCWSSGSRSFYHHVEDLPSSLNVEALHNVGRLSGKAIEFISNWEKPLISTNYPIRTLISSSCAFELTLHDTYLELDKEPLKDRLESLREKGVKLAFVKINSLDPYQDFSDWQCFCNDSGYSFVRDANDINNAFRHQKLALFPVIADLAGMNETQMDIFSELGVKCVWLSSNGLESSEVKNQLTSAAERDMVFFIDAGSIWMDILPEKAVKMVIVNSDDFSHELLERIEDNSKLIIIPGSKFEFLPDDIEEISEKTAIGFDWYAENVSATTAEFLNVLGDRGISKNQLKYMLGENLLDALPKR